jgi:thiol-disulfide isomerase/thioredoxin
MDRARTAAEVTAMRRTVLVAVLLACNSGASPTAATATADDAKEPTLAKVTPEVKAEPEVEPAVEPEPAAPKERIRIVSIDPVKGALAEQLLVEAGKAKQAGKTPYVELWAGWCPPCKKVDALLEDPALQEQLGSVVLIRVDTDTFNKPLTKLGFESPTIPAFYEIDARGRPTARLLHGHGWKSSATIAKTLPAFLLGSG